MGTRGATTRVFAANLGAWLAIMPAAVVTIAVRMDAFGDSESSYSLILAAGWLTLTAALIAAGQFGDRLHALLGSRTALVRIALPVLVVLGLLLGNAPNATLLAIAWILIQLPAAAIVTASLAAGGEIIPGRRRGLLSGLVGASAIVALLIGSTVAALVGPETRLAIWIPVLLGAALCIPLAALPTRHSVDVAPPAPRPTTSLTRLWWLFVAASLLLSWTTSTANDYVVVLVADRSALSSIETAGTATTAIALASGIAVIASIALGTLARTRRTAATAWVAAAVLCAIAVSMLVRHEPDSSVLLPAVLFGLGFGIANGVELSLVLSLRSGSAHLGRDIGFFTAATTAPFVLVPALGAALLADDATGGLAALFTIAAVVALAGAVMTGAIALRRN